MCVWRPYRAVGPVTARPRCIPRTRFATREHLRRVRCVRRTNSTLVSTSSADMVAPRPDHTCESDLDRIDRPSLASLTVLCRWYRRGPGPRPAPTLCETPPDGSRRSTSLHRAALDGSRTGSSSVGRSALTPRCPALERDLSGGHCRRRWRTGNARSARRPVRRRARAVWSTAICGRRDPVRTPGRPSAAHRE